MLDDFLKNYMDKGIYPFHMPGHKRNPLFLPPFLLDRDVTEFPGADNLYSPTGPILETQRMIAGVCGSDECVLLANGSTAGILASIMGTVTDGDIIILARNSHRSAFSALALSGAIPSYVSPEPISGGLAGSVSPSAVLEAISKNRSAKAVFVTSPGYEGIVSDIKAIADLAHEHGMILIVDEAHGAHFPFSEIFPKPAISLGADVVINSAHKTLPALTQTAVLHFAGNRCDKEKIKFMLQCVQSSSPSYILMSDLDWVYRRLDGDKEIFERYAALLQAFRQSLAKWLFSGEGCFGYDVGKLLFLMPNGLKGQEFESLLLDKAKVQLEMSSKGLALAMTSPADTEGGFTRLKRGAFEILGNCRHASGAAPEAPVLPEMALLPRQAIAMPWEEVSAASSVGRVCLEYCAAYPPGVPVLCPGEVANAGTVKQLEEMGKTKIKVQSAKR